MLLGLFVEVRWRLVGQDDANMMRRKNRAAMQNRIPIMTTLRGADTALRAIKSLQGSEVQVRALQEYHK
jgi:hypothetical protein